MVPERQTNGAGFQHSDHMGFGVLDAYWMTMSARVITCVLINSFACACIIMHQCLCKRTCMHVCHKSMLYQVWPLVPDLLEWSSKVQKVHKRISWGGRNMVSLPMTGRYTYATTLIHFSKYY